MDRSLTAKPEIETSPAAGARDELIGDPLTSGHVPQVDNMTLLFFAYREFTGDADRMLTRLGFGRAHHRVLFFVSRKPGMTVAELLQILAITKQSLARVLRQMIASGHIVQRTGVDDRRQRLLFPTRLGRELILALSQSQSDRIARALDGLATGGTQAISRFMYQMVDPEQRRQLAQLLEIDLDAATVNGNEPEQRR